MTNTSENLTPQAQLEEENKVFQDIIRDLNHTNDEKDKHISYLNGVIEGMLLLVTLQL